MLLGLSTALPKLVLFLGDDSLYLFYEPSVGLILVGGVGVVSRLVDVESELALHRLGCLAVTHPGLVVFSDAFQALRHDDDSPKDRRHDGDSGLFVKQLDNGSERARAQYGQGQGIGKVLGLARILAVPLPLPTQVDVEVMVGPAFSVRMQKNVVKC